ncbi:MAG: NlpC/P60 family protein [Pseudonocardiales bacterium]
MASRPSAVRPYRLYAILTAGLLGLVLVPATSNASSPPSSTQLRQSLADLQTRLEKATEDYNTANVLLARSRAHEKELRAEAVQQSKQVDAYTAQVSRFAASVYRGQGIDVMASLLQNGSAQSFLDQMSMLDNLSRTQRSQLNALTAARRQLALSKARIDDELTTQAKDAATKKARKALIEANLAKVKALLPPSTSGGGVVGGSYTGPATGNALKALRTAYAQIGKPYQWGGAGPNSFDCSGLTMYSWRAGGVSLPHSSRMQYSSGPHVARSALQPGDLLFFGSPIHHVAMYVGNGQMIHAPNFGMNVQISPIQSDYVGAVRP